MAKFLKHVGKHGDRKVAVVFRQVPGEEHMCLVVYTEVLNQNIHDPLIACIESDPGQTSEHLGDALNRSYTKDGKLLLQVLHREGMLKKIQTNQVTMTPIPNQSVRLSELNDMLTEMSKGEEAVKKLAELDASRGLQDPKDVARRVKENAAARQSGQASPSILDNSKLADTLRMQAQRMANEAKGLLAESDRLLKEASQMEPPVLETSAAKTTKKVTSKIEKAPVAKATVNRTAVKKSEPVTEPVVSKKTKVKKTATA